LTDTGTHGILFC